MAAGSRFDEGAVQRLFAAAEANVATGRLPACQVALACGDEVRSATFGRADEGSRFVVFSITKSLVAGAVWLLFADGSLSPSTRVADVVPEFATNGKAAVTVAHLLTHTAGFPRAPMRPEEGATSAGRVARFQQWRLDWEPGLRTAYHPSSAHWVLAEVIERVAAQDYRRFVAQALLDPLGLTSIRLGLPAGEQSDVVDVEIIGDADDGGARIAELDALLAEASPAGLLRYNEPDIRAIGVPGVGAVSGAADVARYFQALLHNPRGHWDPEVLRNGTAVVHNALIDPVTKVAANRTLGLSLAGDDGNAWMRELGHNTSPRAFVASGIGGQVAWADPDSGLSFCYLTSGLDADVIRAFFFSSELSGLAALCRRG